MLPATSVPVPDTVWLTPAVEITTGGGHSATPESASIQANVTVTVLDSHPFAFGAGETLTVIVGAVLSMLSVTEAVA